MRKERERDAERKERIDKEKEMKRENRKERIEKEKEMQREKRKEKEKERDAER